MARAHRMYILALASAASVALATSAGARELSVGEPAPDFTAVDTNGVEHSLSDFAEGTVVLEWTNHDCPYVVAHYASNNMQSLQKQAAADGATWLTIISSAPGQQGHVEADKANTLTTSRDAEPAAVLLDPSGEIGRLYAAATTPHMYVIDEGMLVYQGAIDNRQESRQMRLAAPQDRTNYVRAALRAVAAGETPAVTQTEPYGCNVKYAS